MTEVLLMNVVAAEYPHSTFNGTPTCSSHSSTLLHETYEAGRQEESGYMYNFGCQIR